MRSVIGIIEAGWTMMTKVSCYQMFLRFILRMRQLLVERLDTERSVEKMMNLTPVIVMIPHTSTALSELMLLLNSSLLFVAGFLSSSFIQVQGLPYKDIILDYKKPIVWILLEAGHLLLLPINGE